MGAMVMFATKPCVRCSQMPEDHPVDRVQPLTYIELAGERHEIEGRLVCPGYVPPAPLWLRAVTKLLEAISRRLVR